LISKLKKVAVVEKISTSSSLYWNWNDHEQFDATNLCGVLKKQKLFIWLLFVSVELCFYESNHVFLHWQLRTDTDFD